MAAAKNTSTEPMVQGLSVASIAGPSNTALDPQPQPMLVKSGENTPAAKEKSTPAQQFHSSEELQKFHDASLAEAQTLRSDDKLFLAQAKLLELAAALTTARENNLAEVAALATALHSTVTGGEFFKEVQARVREMENMLAEIDCDKGWSLLRDSDGIKTYYQKCEGLPTHSFKVSGVIDSPVFNVIAVLYEIDLYKNWFPFMNKSVDVATVSRFHKVCYLDVTVPWPMSNRDVVIDGYGCDVTEKSQVVIFVRSIQGQDDAPAGVTLPPENKSNVRCDVKFGGFLLKPVSSTQTDVKIVFNVDPQLPIIPFAVLNWIVSKFIHYVLIYMRREAAFKPDSVYNERIAANPAVYSYIKSMFEAVCVREGWSSASASGKVKTTGNSSSGS